MTPKKASSLYRQIAEELNLPEDLVEVFVEFMYKELRTNLTGLSHPRINLEGLGHFAAKPMVVRKAIPRYTKSLENHDTSTFGAYFNKKQLEVKLENLIALEKKMTEQEEKRKTFKTEKHEKSKTNLEKPGPDNGGN